MKINCYILFLLSLFLGTTSYFYAQTVVDYVNPYMGNISHLLVPTYPTVHLPNSMMRIQPVRKELTESKIKGLPVFLTSHRGELAFCINPLQGKDRKISNTYIEYDYDNEIIKPYYYSVYLDNESTKVRFAPSHQSAVYEFDFLGDGIPTLMLSATNGQLRVDGNTVSGYQKVGKTNATAYVYFETNLLPERSSLNKKADNTIAILTFNTENRKIHVRYGVSFISEIQAKKNLYREINDYDVDELATKGKKIWNEAFGKIHVEGSSENDKIVFYTSLYRFYERMVCISEDGKYYSGSDGKIHEDGGIPFFTDDWMWDTYRAAHPLRTIIDREKETAILNSFVRMAEQTESLWLPSFPEIGGDTRRMNCNHGVAIILDCYRKGLTGFDTEKAFLMCKGAITEKTLIPWSAAKVGRLDDFYKTNGYFPALTQGEKETVPGVDSWEKRQPVAVTLGTAYDEWALAQFARELGKTADYNYFLPQSFNYKKIFNFKTKFFHPKDEKGNFIEPLDYELSGGVGGRDAYDENTGWIYRWDVQQNIKDLITLMGGNKSFVEELERTFNTPLQKPKYEFYAQFPDHTGNVGQFSMANEPALHIPYLYTYIGEAWRTQKRIRNLLSQWFRNDYMGIPGDEDGGGMSAFVVFSQLGFYPVTPGLPMYVIGSPVFENSKIDLGNGKAFRIKCHNYSTENKYIQSAKFNGKNWDKSWFSHTELIAGGLIEFTMGKYPNKKWAVTSDAVPPSFDMSN
jgi:predicted alpha-1,2-mannosidase